MERLTARLTLESSAMRPLVSWMRLGPADFGQSPG
jgi:hypothetical protein